MRRPVLRFLVVLLSFLWACGDHGTSPLDPPEIAPEILDDGELSADQSTRANKFIQFAPPVVPPFGFERLPFAPTLELDPVVEVCELTDAATGTPQTCVDAPPVHVKTYTRDSGGVHQERVLDGHFDNYVVWVDLKDPAFDSSKDYRFSVRVGVIFGGYADLRFVQTGGEWFAEWRGGEYAPVRENWYPFRFILYEGFTGCGAFPGSCSETPVATTGSPTVSEPEPDGTTTATYTTTEPSTVAVDDDGDGDADGGAQVADGDVAIVVPPGEEAPETIALGSAFIPSASPCLENVQLADPFLAGTNGEPEVCLDVFLFDPATGRRFVATLPQGSVLAYCVDVTGDKDLYSNGSLPSDEAGEILYLHENVPQPSGFPGTFGPSDCGSGGISMGPFPSDGSLFAQGRWLLERGFAALRPTPVYALDLGFVHGVTVLRAGDINVTSSYPQEIAVVDQDQGAPPDGTLESSVTDTYDVPLGGTLDLSTVAVHHDELVSETFDAHEIAWTSSDPAVAAVDASTGEVTAVGTGTAVITAEVQPYAGSTLSAIRGSDGLPITDDVTVSVALPDVGFTASLSSSTLEINGPVVPYSGTISNNESRDLETVVIQAWVEQGTTRRAGGGALVTCGPAIGTLPPGSCSYDRTVSASDQSPTAGTGTFAPGAAEAVIELKLVVDGQTTLLEELRIPITLDDTFLTFDSDRDGTLDIFTASSTGGHPTNLTQDPALDVNPKWAPDGTRIAFASDRSGDLEVWIMNADGTSLQQVTTTPGADRAHSWFPGGDSLVVSSAFGSTGLGVFVMATDGSNRHLVIDNAGSGAVSPDGTRIAVEHVDPQTGILQIFVVDTDGSNPQQLTTVGTNARPAWSPDGTKIAFTSSRDGNIEVYVMNADGTNQVNITTVPTLETEPAWSRDGRIYFQTDRDGNLEIYVADADGTNVTRLTSDAGTDRNPDLRHF